MEGFEVAGRRFRTEADYQAAKRDLQKIEEIRQRNDLRQPGEVIRLYEELQAGQYRFETAVGNDFDDEIYELASTFRKEGYTRDSRISGKELKKAKKRSARTGKETKAKQPDKPAETKETGDQMDAEMRREVRRELKRRERRRRLLIICCSVVAVGCLGYFGTYSYYADRTEMDYSELAQLKGTARLSPEVTIHYTQEEEKELTVLEEYQTLYNKNKSLVGWLKIADTNIDYPVMQTVNNEYYLDHNFNQEYDKNGSLFLDKDCDIVHRNTNLIIYGHHMKSGKMFGNLNDYQSEEYGKKHALIQFDTIYEKGTYQIMYVFRSRVYSEEEVVFKYYQFLDAVSEKEFTSNMQEMAELSLYDTGVTAQFGDELLTLSTCDSSEKDGRFVVVAKRIS